MTHYHFVGIKGSGMSSLAQIMHDLGHEVQGSDIENYVFTEVALRNKGIKILPFDANNIKEDMVVIQGNAFASSHEEIVRAHQLKLDVVSYNDFLGQIIDQYTSVAVTGAHGKTSTTGLLSHVMNGDKKTSFLIGDGTGMGLPESDYFAFEACEYRRHFLSYKPDYAIMTNIDFDHPDYFKDINDVFDAFQEMAHNVKKVLLLGVMMNIYVKLKQMFQFIIMDLKIRMTFMLKIFKLRIKVLLLMCVWMVSFMITSCLHNMVTIQF